MKTDPVYYVYLKFGLDSVPRYVGKGKDNRAWEHENWGCHNKQLQGIINKAKKLGRELPTVFLAECLTEEEAFALEILWIKTIGRYDLGEGPLVNHTDGGDGVSGASFSEERRKQISEFQRGRPKSDQMKARLSVSTEIRMSRPEELERAARQMAERTGTEEFRAWASDHMTALMSDEEFREAAIERLVGYTKSTKGRKTSRDHMNKLWEDPVFAEKKRLENIDPQRLAKLHAGRDAYWAKRRLEKQDAT